MMWYYCSECKLYWIWMSKDEIQIRLCVFAPIIIKKCPYCENPNKKVPKILKEFRKKVC